MDEKILYIVIAIIWIASSVFKAVNKKNQPEKKQTNDTASEDDTDNDFETIFEEMILGKSPQVPKPQKNYESYDEISDDENFILYNETQNQKYTNYEGSVSHDFSKIKKLEDDKNIFKSSLIQDEIQLFDDEDSDLDTDIFGSEGFDMRKAVLYSEILKRPQY